MNEMADTHTLLGQSNALCTDHECPRCGLREHVTAERVLFGDATLTVCHCRVCGHSWHPRVDADPI